MHDLRKLRVNLNDFEQKKVIGKGHFGVVQVVREKATGNVFALKSLRKSDTLSQQHVSRKLLLVFLVLLKFCFW